MLSTKKVVLSLPNSPDVEKLKEMYTESQEDIKKLNQLLDRNIGGVMFNESFRDMIEVCYPLVNPHEDQATKLVRAIVAPAIVKLSKVITLRYDAAISGAMRWEGSQEAKINLEEMRYA
jgi:hypothetical protein